MARTKKVKEPVEETVEEVIETPIEEVVEEVEYGKTDTVVVDKKGEVVRVFTKSIHGKDAKDLAEEFAKKFGHKVK